MTRRYFAVGTRPGLDPGHTAVALADALNQLLAGRRPTGRWGGPDELDQFITTCHAVMTLMAAGVSPRSWVLEPALTWLAQIDVTRITTFYWRSGPLLNVTGYEDVIRHDAAHIWRFKGRAGGNPSYPAPFFLLKLVRFFEGSQPLDTSVDEIVAWAIDEWNEEDAWYGRTSITSMGLALVADLGLMPEGWARRAADFLIAQFGVQSDGRRGFSENVIDDAFTVYNLYERWDDLQVLLPAELWDALSKCADDLLSRLESPADLPPPFGGTVDSPDYARSVIARALMAKELSTNDGFDTELAIALVNANVSRVLATMEGAGRLNPFWGNEDIADEGYCFVLMPFSPPRLTEIYEDYIKKPLEQELGILCRRADDIFQPTPIMADIWRSINRAKFIVADLSNRNPNVFYELGLAHVIGKPVILVAGKHKDVPFDLQSVRTIIYGDSPNSWKRLASEIVEYARPYVSGGAP